LLTALACPQESEAERSLQHYLSLCGKALWLKHLSEPDDWTPITVKPQYVFRHYKSINRDVGFVVKRVRERMVAGRMAIPFFQQADLGRLPPLPKDVHRLSLNQMAEFVLDDAGQAETGLSHCCGASAKRRRLRNFQAAATAVRHVSIATARSSRCVWAEVR